MTKRTLVTAVLKAEDAPRWSALEEARQRAEARRFVPTGRIVIKKR